jgi:hypothetical protein
VTWRGRSIIARKFLCATSAIEAAVLQNRYGPGSRRSRR